MYLNLLFWSKSIFSTFILSILISFTALSQQSTLSGELVNCQADSMRLFMLEGSAMKLIHSVPLAEDEGTYTFSMALNDIPPGFYIVGDGRKGNSKFLLLGEDEEMKLTGQCNALGSAQIWNSELNSAFKRLLRQSDSLEKEHASLIKAYQIAQRAKGDTAEVNSKLAKIDSLKVVHLERAKEEHNLLGSTLALKTYLSYQNRRELAAAEKMYFADFFFQFVDFKDPIYNRIPLVIDAFKQYSSTLAQIGLSEDLQEKSIAQYLGGIPPNTTAYKFALTGTILGLKDANPNLFMSFSEDFLSLYKESDPYFSNTIISERTKLSSRVIGAIAPEISLPTPQGDTLNLSDLRGKVVLIDFWASWCGPCRRENPNVKRVYEKYNPMGFEILGVSLDRTKGAWTKAIEADGLTWHHVSDLKYWQSSAAQTYGVHGIPYTVLLDKEGKIIATKLRGKGLERKLAEIFSDEEQPASVGGK